MAVAAFGGLVVDTSTFGALFVSAWDWTLGHDVIRGLALEAALPFVTPGFVG